MIGDSTALTRAGWSPDASRIDQVVYVWSRHPRTGAQGFFPVASSLGSATARSWDDLPASQLLAQDALADHATASLAYVVGSPAQVGPAPGAMADVSERAALVHRIRVPRRSGTGPGRLRAHVLTGRADYLTERVALALHAAGTGRADSPRTSTRLAPLHLADLTTTRRTGEGALRQAARATARRHRLANVIASVLVSSRAGQPFAISHTGSDEAVTLMWALVELLEDVLPYRLTFASRMTPSFAWDAADEQAGRAGEPPRGTAYASEGALHQGFPPGEAGLLPRFLLAPRPPTAGPGTEQTMIHVDPRIHPAAPLIVLEAARVLVDVYGHNGMRGVATLLGRGRLEPFDLEEPERWSQRLVAAARTSARPPAPGRTIPPPTPPARHVPAAEHRCPQTRAVGEYLRDAYTQILDGHGSDDGQAADPKGPDPTQLLITILTAPIGLPPDLPGADRLRGQLRRLAGLLTRPAEIASRESRPSRAPDRSGQSAGRSTPAGPAMPTSSPAPARPAASEIAAAVMARVRDAGPSRPDMSTAAAEIAVLEAQRRVEAALVTLADTLASLRGPSPARTVCESLDEARSTLEAGLTTLFTAYGLPASADQARRLTARTLDSLRPGPPTPWPAGQPHLAGHGHSPAQASTSGQPASPAPADAHGSDRAREGAVGRDTAHGTLPAHQAAWTPVVTAQGVTRPAPRTGWTPATAAESPSAAVVRLMRETQAWGADAFRLFILYVPDWSGAHDLRQAVLATGVGPFYRRLDAAGGSGADPGHRPAVIRRLLDLYSRGGARPAAGPDVDLQNLCTEIDARLAPGGPRDALPGSHAALGVRPDPAAAFLAACGPGRPDAARAFGLLAQHVPDWSADQDLYQALCRWRKHDHRDGGSWPGGARLAAAAEEYFRQALQGAHSETPGPRPADLERVTRRLIALYHLPRSDEAPSDEARLDQDRPSPVSPSHARQPSPAHADGHPHLHPGAGSRTSTGEAWPEQARSDRFGPEHSWHDQAWHDQAWQASAAASSGPTIAAHARGAGPDPRATHSGDRDRTTGVDAPRLPTAGDLTRAVETWIVAAVAGRGPDRRRRRAFGLPGLPFTPAFVTPASAASAGHPAGR
ncbi:conserved hypothetical protein [Frankia sp. AiPs1]|uniref:hypothetical protein n=1 Tax=Frankia sp. AiPa1 TaxID=573492 RepID=UPI00202B7189|nr:hypothetical protein [Frankia sp. AiPa1]MCL9759441.1 hypothetical protein [Frankia sp. AiPa1]